MTPAARLAEVTEADRFVADPKFLTEGLPEWTDSHITGRLTAQWPIIDGDGVLREGTRLVFGCKAEDVSRLSVSLLLHGNRIAAVDLVPGSECKMNGPGAARLKLPPRVCGSHFHLWEDNRDHALATGLGDVPHRRPTPRHLTRLPHALAALAQTINLTLTPEQASFDVPPTGRLNFRGGGK